MLRLMLLGSLAGADGVESTVRAFVTKSNPNARDSLLVTGYTQVPQKRGSSRPSRPSRPCAYGLISYGPTLMPTHAHTHKHTQWQGALRDEAGVYGWFTDAIHTYLGSQVCMIVCLCACPTHGGGSHVVLRRRQGGEAFAPCARSPARAAATAGTLCPCVCVPLALLPPSLSLSRNDTHTHMDRA